MKLFIAFRFHGLSPGVEQRLRGEKPASPSVAELASCLNWMEEQAAILHLAAESDWLVDWERDPVMQTLARRLVDEQRLFPVVTHGLGAHVAFLSRAELADELMQNQRRIHQFFRVPADRTFGLWGSAWGVDLSKLPAEPTYRWIIVPTPAPASGASGFSSVKGVASRMLPARTAYSDRMRGLVADLQAKRRTVADAASCFARSLEDDAACTAPQIPLILGLDLGYGETGGVIQILSGALQILKTKGPVEWIDSSELREDPVVPSLGDKQVFGYYPEETEVVRTDGLYPALLQPVSEAATFQAGHLAALRPFILWEEGRFMLRLLDYFYDGFDFPRVTGTGPDLGREKAPAPLQHNAEFLLRYVKHAAHWGPRPSSRDRMRVLTSIGYLIALFRGALNERRIAKPSAALPDFVTRGLRAVLRFQIDNPVAAYEQYWKTTASRGGYLMMAAHLKEVREHRQRASEGISRMESAIAALAVSPGAWFRAVDMLDVYVRELKAAFEALERYGNLERESEDFFRTLYPPQLPAFLDRLESTPVHPKSTERLRPGRHSAGEVPGEIHPW